MISSATRPLVPLQGGQSKPLSHELLKQIGERESQGTRLDTKALGPITSKEERVRSQNRQMLVGLKDLLRAEFGASTTSLNPAFKATGMTAADRKNISLVLGSAFDAPGAKLPDNQVELSLESAGRMVRGYETDASNFMNVQGKTPKALMASHADVHKCGYGLMTQALLDATQWDELAAYRMDSKDNPGVYPQFKPEFRQECMGNYHRLMGESLAAHPNGMTYEQVDALTRKVMADMAEKYGQESAPAVVAPAPDAAAAARRNKLGLDFD